jgi:cytochrome c553
LIWIKQSQNTSSLNCARKMNKLLTTVFALAVASVTGASFAQGIKGDAIAGERKNAMCVGCHGIIGFHASFPEVYKVPKIAGQSAKYIVAALNGYKDGTRKHPSMRAIATSLTEQDMADLAAFYADYGGASTAVPDVPVAQPTARAAKLMAVANCASCHGANFNAPMPGYPKLAGQNRDYLGVAAKAYLSPDKRLIGRKHALMEGILKAQHDLGAKEFHADLSDTLDYIAALPGDVKTVQLSRIR